MLLSVQAVMAMMVSRMATRSLRPPQVPTRTSVFTPYSDSSSVT